MIHHFSIKHLSLYWPSLSIVSSTHIILYAGMGNLEYVTIPELFRKL